MLMLLSYTCSTPHLPAPATEPVRVIQTVLVKQLCGRASVYIGCSIHTVCPTHFPFHLKSTPLSVGVIRTLSIWPTSIVYDIFPKLYSTHILEAHYTSTFAVKTLNTLVVSSPLEPLANMSTVAAPPSPPRRRFVPEPIEVSRTSKRQQHGTLGVEQVKGIQEKPRQEDGEAEVPIKSETPATDPPRRRFAPEPVETSVRSSRKKFAPEPVETSTRSSKDKKKDVDVDDKPPARRKFLPEPVETASTSTRRRRKEPDPEEEVKERQPSQADLDLSRTSSSTSSSSRKFKPEVLEVARASYRKDKSSNGPGSPKDRQLPSPPSSPETSKLELADPLESRFSAAALARRHHQERKHSFQVPELDIIQSESSDEDNNTLALSDVLSSESDTDQSSVKGPKYHAIDRRPNNVHEIPAKPADKDLTNQMLAAYINERPYEPVAHFAVDDEGYHGGRLSGINGIDTRTFRRDSETEHQWELENLQKHHAELERMKEEFKQDTAAHSRFSAAALAARHHGIGKKEKKKGQDEELKKMRNAAKPPMLGGDLWFPQSLSPKMTRCDVDQIPRPRTNDDHDYEEVEGDPMLWQTNSNVSAHSGGGLWAGLCQKPEHETRPPTPLRSGLQTPAVEAGNPFESPRPRTPGTKTPSRRHRPNFSGSHFLPLTPPRDLLGDDPFTASIDKKLNFERSFDDQFPPQVITQIYNYISLGYPVLAHQFDEELSKISRIPVHDLRKDDEHTDAKGHVSVPEGVSVEEDVAAGRCKRWEALRLYCKEWYRQSPQMIEKRPEEWGSNNRLRRGSWNR